MTSQHQKSLEIVYAKKACELLCESWQVEPSPDEVSWPDLIVTTESGQFGLEVREIFLDESKKGSIKKANEKKNLKTINNLADAYYKKTHLAINVNFLGVINHNDLVLNSLIKEARQLFEFEHKRIQLCEGSVIYITRLPDQCAEYRRWKYVSDRVGFLRNIDKDVINSVIIEKAKKLPKYMKNISDVRLLLVSNRIFNSGKHHLENTTYNASNFICVYYLSYPDEASRLSVQQSHPIDV
jgi:hypothetical protein